MKKSYILVGVALFLTILLAVVAVILAILLYQQILNQNQASTAKTRPVVNPTTTTTQQPVDRNWWMKHPIYQIYPRSFQDSNGDGTGDLRGIINRIDYLYQIGIRSVWLSPIYQSPMKDFGYDISNFTAIDPLFGTISDFQELVAKMHQRGMYLIMDFVPNHSSDQHYWFQQSVKNASGLYGDYYVWKDAKSNGSPPNNWISVFGNSTWHWVPSRNKSYLHQFLIEQPDLNFRNPKVCQEMEDVISFWLHNGVDGFRIDAVKHLISAFGNSSWQWVPARNQYYYHNYLVAQPDLNYRNVAVRQHMENALSFWIGQGVDGFRIDAIIHLVENSTFADEPRSNDPNALPNEYGYLKPIYTTDQPLTYQVFRNWTYLLEKFGREHNKHIFTVAEAYTDMPHTLEYYKVGCDFPFNFQLIQLDHTTNATGLAAMVNFWMNNMPKGRWPNWVVGNHDNHRVASRMGGNKYTDVVNMLLLLLPGTPTCYYGDEIGMTDVFVPYNETQDPAGKKWGPDMYVNFTRDPERTPMQWTNAALAGFSNSKNGTWLPLGNYSAVNVQEQQSRPRSHLSVFKALFKLRNMPTFLQSGENIQILNVNQQDLFVFRRYLSGAPDYVVILNIGHSQRTSTLVLDGQFFTSKSNATVVMRSGNVADNEYSDNQVISLTDTIKLQDAQGLVLRI